MYSRTGNFLYLKGLIACSNMIIRANNFSDVSFDRQILLASEIGVFIGIIFSFQFLIPYSVIQYVGAGLIMFVAAEVLEGNTNIKLIIIHDKYHKQKSILRIILTIIIDITILNCYCCRRQSFTTLQSNVIQAFPWNVQWRPSVDRSWYACSSDCRCNNHHRRFLR